MPEACVPFCAKPAAQVQSPVRMFQFAFGSPQRHTAEPAAETSAPHELQAALPASAYELAAHCAHEAAPAAAAVPAAHSVHTAGCAVSLPPACEKPAAHTQPPAALHVAAASVQAQAPAQEAAAPAGQAAQGGAPVPAAP